MMIIVCFCMNEWQLQQQPQPPNLYYKEVFSIFFYLLLEFMMSKLDRCQVQFNNEPYLLSYSHSIQFA